jgi:hypothetical protein
MREQIAGTRRLWRGHARAVAELGLLVNGCVEWTALHLQIVLP